MTWEHVLQLTIVIFIIFSLIIFKPTHFLFICLGKVIVQQNQGGQVKALLQSPAKTPQLQQQQQVIVKQGTTTPVVQKINPANAVMVSGGQVFTSGQQQVVVSGSQVITTGSGQQVKT